MAKRGSFACEPWALFGWILFAFSNFTTDWRLSCRVALCCGAGWGLTNAKWACKCFIKNVCAFLPPHPAVMRSNLRQTHFHALVEVAKFCQDENWDWRGEGWLLVLCEPPTPNVTHCWHKGTNNETSYTRPPLPWGEEVLFQANWKHNMQFCWELSHQDVGVKSVLGVFGDDNVPNLSACLAEERIWLTNIWLL